jgi:hypothetical protein
MAGHRGDKVISRRGFMAGAIIGLSVTPLKGLVQRYFTDREFNDILVDRLHFENNLDAVHPMGFGQDYDVVKTEEGQVVYQGMVWDYDLLLKFPHKGWRHMPGDSLGYPSPSLWIHGPDVAPEPTKIIYRFSKTGRELSEVGKFQAVGRDSLTTEKYLEESWYVDPRTVLGGLL